MHHLKRRDGLRARLLVLSSGKDGNRASRVKATSLCPGQLRHRPESSPRWPVPRADARETGCPQWSGARAVCGVLVTAPAGLGRTGHLRTPLRSRVILETPGCRPQTPAWPPARPGFSPPWSPAPAHRCPLGGKVLPGVEEGSLSPLLDSDFFVKKIHRRN